jgi:glutathione S-transferase
MANQKLQLFTFPAAHGLPTFGPFGLKLEVCLRMLGVPYERVYEADHRKGPKRKSPWIVDGDVTMGDTELILAHVMKKHGKTLDEGATPEERGRSHALRRMMEEHFHACFEHELFGTEEGYALVKSMMAGQIPGLLISPVAAYVRRGFMHHLFERGIGRHAVEERDAMGRADVDAMVALLGDRDFFLGDRPTKVDASAYGLLAPAIEGPLGTPLCTYTRAQPTLVRFVDRMTKRFFPEQSEKAEVAKAAAAA